MVFAEAIAVPKDALWRLSVNQYHAMVDAGILISITILVLLMWLW